MNSISEAFAEAGYRTPDQRVRQIAVDAWGKWPTDASARRIYVVERLRGQEAWALFTGWQPGAESQAVGWLLNRAKAEIEAARPMRDAGKPAGGGGQSGLGNQRRIAPTSNLQDRVQPQAGRVREPASMPSTTRVVAPAPSNLTALADKQAAASASRVQTEIRLSRLDTVLIDGKRIGDCTVAEVRAWAERRQQDARHAGRDARFALALIGTLHSGEIIRQRWQNPDEVEAMYSKAEAEHAA